MLRSGSHQLWGQTKGIFAETQEQIARGRLVENVIKGQDKGVQSAYRLGQDRRVNMFTPDTMTGVIVLNVPTTQASEDKPADLDEPNVPRGT